MHCFPAALIGGLCLSSSAFAQTELTESDIRSIFETYPVGCLGPVDGDRCGAITTTTLLTASRGVEQSLVAFEAEAGIYVIVAISSNFTLDGDGVCYPNASADMRGAQMFLSSSLGQGLKGAQPLPAEGREFVTRMVIDPLVNMIGQGKFCTRYYIPAARDRSDIYLARTFLDEEEFDEPALVQQMPQAAFAGLELFPAE